MCQNAKWVAVRAMSAIRRKSDMQNAGPASGRSGRSTQRTPGLRYEAMAGQALERSLDSRPKLDL